MTKIHAAVFATLGLVFTPWCALAADQTAVGIDTSGLAAQIQVGDQFVVPITVANVPAATGLGSWQFDLDFDPTILSATAVTEGSFLSSFGQTSFSPPVIDDTGGQIIGAADSYDDLLPDPYGSGVLADVDFTALAAGASPLTLANVFLDFSDSGFSTPSGPVAIPVTGSAPVAAPEPPSVALLAVGALLLAAGSRLKKELPR